MKSTIHNNLLKIFASLFVLICLCLYLVYHFWIPLGTWYTKDNNFVCYSKRISYSPKEYVIKDSTIFMKVEELDEQVWSKHLKPISQSKEEFIDCEANRTELPDVIKKVEKGMNPKGLRLEFYQKKDGREEKVATVIMDFALYANRNTNEQYDLNHALQDIADSFKLEKIDSKNQKLIFTSSFVNPEVEKAKRYYLFVQKINGQYVDKQIIEFISTGNGKMWKVFKEVL